MTVFDLVNKRIRKTSYCWIWIGNIGGRGYGTIHIRPKVYLAHRVVYQLYYGPIVGDLTLDHLCRNRRCVNPDHLEPVTRGENVLRGNGVSAQNARKTHCLNGHPLFGENLRVRLGAHGPERKCRTCARIRTREQKRRVRAMLKLRVASTLKGMPHVEKNDEGQILASS